MARKKGERTISHQQMSEMWDSVQLAMAHLSNVHSALLANAPDEIMPNAQLKAILQDNIANSGIPNTPDTKPIANYAISFLLHKTVYFPSVHNRALCVKIRDDIASAVDLSREQTTIQPMTSAPHPGWDQVIS